MNLLRASLLLALTVGAAAEAQSAPDWTRADRVVLFSPHFDLVPAPSGGVSCPPQPLHLYGFETTAQHATTSFLVRLTLPVEPRRGGPPVPYTNEPVRLARRWQDGRFDDLPDTPTWSASTDSSGRALLRAPAGIYELRINAGMALGRGVIRIRAGRHDSLHAYVLSAALC
jgi:hypothetical protein